MIRLGLMSTVLALLLGGCAVTPDRDMELERLRADLEAVDRDPSLADLAPVERDRARRAVDAVLLLESRDRALPLFVAQRRIDIARAAAEAELARQQLDQLDRERDRILLEASRRDAELARREAERLRVLSMARAEEAERAFEDAEAARYESVLSSAEADQARRLADAQATEAALARREAELAGEAAASLRMQLQSMSARSEDRGEVMTLSGEAFASGAAQLRAEARSNLQKVVDFVQQNPGAQVLIEGHTDSQGSANLNQALSQRRAEAVRDALVQEGVDAARLRARGVGADRPVADNATAAGRAQNRRVEIVVLQASAG